MDELKEIRKEDKEAKKEDKKKSSLDKLKKTYEEYKKKYDLPEFRELNENFEIEGIDSEDTEVLLKIIRKHLTEKMFYILRTLETFLNPSNAPMFVFTMIKSFSESEKELIQELYKRIAKHEIEAFGLEAKYDEKKEAEFIKKAYLEWKTVSDDLLLVYKSMKENFDKESKKSTKSYFG
jgi:hypothetical protein